MVDMHDTAKGRQARLRDLFAGHKAPGRKQLEVGFVRAFACAPTKILVLRAYIELPGLRKVAVP